MVNAGICNKTQEQSKPENISLCYRRVRVWEEEQMLGRVSRVLDGGKQQRARVGEWDRQRAIVPTYRLVLVHVVRRLAKG